jgi:hypothetical protein
VLTSCLVGDTISIVYEAFLLREENRVMKWLLIPLLMISFISNAEDIIYIKSKGNDIYKKYPKKLLTRVLEVTEKEYGEFNLVESENDMKRKRRLLELIQGERLHVSTQATSADWEEQAIPIYIPIQKGILGYRVFVLKKEDADLFANISTKRDLKKIPTGSGATWSITKIFQDYGFNIVTGGRAERLYKMLKADRFKAYSRGIEELQGELKGKGDVVVDKHIAIYTELPRYFFVSPTKPRLAQRIEKGLQVLVDSGEFERLFNESHMDILQGLNLDQRRVFRLNNDKLSSLVPKGDKYWINFDLLMEWEIVKGKIPDQSSLFRNRWSRVY